MDGSTVDHSDSDSGESWTLLDNQPAFGDVAPDFPENVPTPIERDHTEAHLDEDTDVSIISDSEPESPCNISCNKCSISENHPINSHDINPFNPTPQKKTIESICNGNDFLGDETTKHKTYVHRRNQKVSMVLNIIMLGSVITAAGVAIGHMWGAKNECTGPIPSVNKILANFYKLQEENAYLRNKVKELTLANKINEVPKPNKAKKIKQQRCKKIFEEPLNNKAEKAFKCLDGNDVKILGTSDLLVHEKEFLNDIGELKKVYNQNKSWLDDHIQRRFDYENKMRNKRNIKDDFLPEKGNPERKAETTLKLPNLEEHDENNTPDKEFRLPESNQGTKSHKAWTLKKQSHATKNKNYKNKLTKDNKPDKVIEKKSKSNEDITSSESFETISSDATTKEKKISYADSLRTDSEHQKHIQKNDDIELPITGVRGYNIKKKHGDVDRMLNLISSSEEDIKKDNRYIGPKMKHIKKQDRHKIHKKQKRKNKYEQWEMKGGYMKDFDDFSLTSSQVNLGSDFMITPDKKYLNHDFENYISKLTETKEIKKPKPAEDNKDKRLEKKEKGKKGKGKDPEWYEKRYALRTEARKILEQELFGETTPNTAGWYFRRMNKREQCRAQKDNNTFKKFSKQKMNFKMKH